MNTTASDSRSPRIAVIGPSQSGKTCLAVGLAATSTRNFTIQPRDNSATAYLDARKAEIAHKKWPAANLVGREEPIRLDFVSKGKPTVLVDFPEYGGEVLRDESTFKAFANQYLRDLDGVVILLNPGAEAFQSGDEALRLDAIAQYSRVLSFLSDPNSGSSKAFVALVVTAADRIAPGGDLRNKSTVFSASAKEVENIVRSNSFRHKWFHVTITGRLQTQDNPELAKGRRNSASKPFQWLLWKIKWGPIRRAWFRRVRVAALILIALGASVGVYFYTKERREKNSIKDVANQLDNLIHGFDGSTMISDNDLNDVVTNLNKLCKNKSSDLAQEMAKALEQKVWQLFKGQIKRKIDDIKSDPSQYATMDAIQAVDALFDKFVPQNDPPKNDHGKYRESWDKEQYGLREQNIVQELIDEVEKPLNALTALHNDSVLKQLSTLYTELGKINPPDGNNKLIEKKNELAKKLDERMAEELRHWNQYDDLSPESATNNAQSLQEHADAWNPMTPSGDETKKQIKTEIENKLSTFLSAQDRKMKEICDDWVRIYVKPDRSRTGQDSLWTDYETFAKKNSGNPYFSTVVQAAVYKQVENWFEIDVCYFRRVLYQHPLWKDEKNLQVNYKELQERFQNFVKLCRVVAGSEEKNHLRTSWAWQFAKLCVENGHVKEGIDKAFPQKLVVTNISGAISYYDAKEEKDRYPTNYKYTSFAARVEVIQRNPDGSVASTTPTLLLPFEKNGKDAKNSETYACTKKEKSKTFLKEPRTVNIHPLEEVRLVPVVTDWNGWAGAKTYQCVRFIGKFNQNDKLDSLKHLDLSFDLNHTDGIGKPTLEMSIDAYIDGDGIGDYMEKAKTAAADYVSGKRDDGDM